MIMEVVLGQAVTAVLDPRPQAHRAGRGAGPRGGAAVEMEVEMAAGAVADPLDAQPRVAVSGQQRGELTGTAPVGRQPAAGRLAPERHAGAEVLRREVEKMVSHRIAR